MGISPDINLCRSAVSPLAAGVDDAFLVGDWAEILEGGVVDQQHDNIGAVDGFLDFSQCQVVAALETFWQFVNVGFHTEDLGLGELIR